MNSELWNASETPGLLKEQMFCETHNKHYNMMSHLNSLPVLDPPMVFNMDKHVYLLPSFPVTNRWATIQPNHAEQTLTVCPRPDMGISKRFNIFVSALYVCHHTGLGLRFIWIESTHCPCKFGYIFYNWTVPSVRPLWLNVLDVVIVDGDAEPIDNDWCKELHWTFLPWQRHSFLMQLLVMRKNV